MITKKRMRELDQQVREATDVIKKLWASMCLADQPPIGNDAEQTARELTQQLREATDVLEKLCESLCLSGLAGNADGRADA